MAVRDNQPLQGGFATVVALTLISAAPVLAAPDRNICDDAAEPTLEVSTTEFSTAAPEDANESVKLLGPNFEFASRERVVGDEDRSEQNEHGLDEDADAEQSDTAIPADAGPLVYKRQMYRRDI